MNYKDVTKIDKKCDFAVLRNQDLDQDQWINLMENSSTASPFQNQAFYRFFKSQPNMDAEVFAIGDSDLKYQCLAVIAIYSRKGLLQQFTSRAIIYGGPLIRNGAKQSCLDFLLKSVWKELASRVVYFESRNFSNFKPYENVFSANKWQYLAYLNSKLHLTYPNLDQYLKSVGYNRRREIKLTLNAGVSYRQVKSDKEIEDLYQILNDLYKNKLNLPLPSLAFFQTLWANGLTLVFVVLDGSKVVGGAICPFLERKRIFTFYYCGLRKYRKNVFPTHLAVLSAIEYGIENGLEVLDFMGAGLKGEDYGVRDYKMGFGGELVEEGRFRKISKPLIFKVGEWGLGILKRIKKRMSMFLNLYRFS